MMETTTVMAFGAGAYLRFGGGKGRREEIAISTDTRVLFSKARSPY